MQEPQRRAGSAALLLWLSLLLAAGFMALMLPRWLPSQSAAFEYVLSDLRTRWLMAPQPERRMVIVDIDEKSLADIGPWPWPRATVAQLIRTLADDYKAGVIAVDMVFPENREGDALLAAQLGRAGVVSGAVFELSTQGGGTTPSAPARLGPPPLALRYLLGTPAATTLPQARPVVANHSGLKPAVQAHISPFVDGDGAVRRLPALLCQGAQCWPALSLAAYAQLLDSPSLQLSPGQGWFSSAWQLSVLSGAGQGPATTVVPLDEHGAMTVPWRHSRNDWVALSATDILQHRPPPELLAGTVVLVGSTALGLADVISTPLAATAAGVEPHAEALMGLLDNRMLIVPQHAPTLEAGLMLIPSLLLLLGLAAWRHPWQRALLVPGWLIGCWGLFAVVTVGALSRWQLQLPLLPLVVFAPLTMLLVICAEIYREARTREGVLALLEAYLPQSVARRLAQSRSTRLAGSQRQALAERRFITVMFVDVQGFGGLCENQSPETIATLLQRLFAVLSDAVARHHGTVDKYIGDAVMALWNAPDDDGQHAVHALACARDILAHVEPLQHMSTQLGLPPVRLGIGMESGAALVGHFGTEHRRTYTALGDPVVLANRLEGKTTEIHCNLLVGPGFARALRQQAPASADQMIPLGEHQLRGRSHTTPLYTFDIAEPAPAAADPAFSPPGSIATAS
jgi:adenylate cyclase